MDRLVYIFTYPIIWLISKLSFSSIYIVSDILYYHNEEYPVTFITTDTVVTTDTTYIQTTTNTVYENRDVLYVNDADNDDNIIYKYNLTDSEYMDTIILNSSVNDIIYY